VLHRSDRWTVSQAGSYSDCTENIPGSLSDSSRPWRKTTSEYKTCKGKNPTQSLAELLETCQELTSSNTRCSLEANHTKGLHRSDRSRAPVRLVTPGQHGMNSITRVNSSKSNSRSPVSLHGFAQDFGDSRNTSWALYSQDLVHQNLL
jgi:hypothetical protein